MTPETFWPNAPWHRADPHPLLRRMREQAPVHRWTATPASRPFWYLTRYADVRRALHDRELGRELDRLPDELAAPHRRDDIDPLPAMRRNVFNLDPPDHTRLRRLIAPAFGARHALDAARHVRQVVDDLVAAMVTGDDVADLVESLALPLPLLVVADLIGFPPQDRDRLRRWSDEMLRSRHAGRIARAGAEFATYVENRLDERRATPDDDLLTHLCRAERAGELERPETVATVFQLLFAGDETTVNLIGNTVLELLRHPDQLDLVRADPDLLDGAVEEVMRFNGPVGHARPLYALADVKYGDTLIPCGDLVVPVLLAANRDPAAFPDPDTFDVTRTPNRHLGFGHGIHFCLGAALARLQARVAVGTLLRRLPGLSLGVAPEDLVWTPELFLHGVERLPVRLGPR